MISIASAFDLGQRVGVPAHRKADGSLVTEIDVDVQRRLSAWLQQSYPGTAVLGEEMDHDQQSRALAERGAGLWCIDPIDGTTNFSLGFPFFGISVALIDDSGPRLGIVYDPVREECFSAERGHGAWLNGLRLQTARNDELRHCIANIDHKRLVARLSERLVRSPPYRSQRNLGASVLEWCWLASGRIQLYLHGGQKLWDYAAGVLILAEAGGCCETIDGRAIDCDTLTKRSVVAASNPRLFREWRRWVQRNMDF